MKIKSSQKIMEYEWVSPGWMFCVLSAVSVFCRGYADDFLYDISIRGIQARLFAILSLVFFLYLYLHAWGKICNNTYRIFNCASIFMVLMILGHYYVLWWNGWMAIPLTILWYPFHRRVLESLPRKEAEKETGEDGK